MIKIIRSSSPTSIKVTMRGILEAKSQTFKEVLSSNYTVSTNLFKLSNDFVEGVRAKIVEKDNNPKWKPSTLEDVSNEYVDSIFKKERVLSFELEEGYYDKLISKL
jgi:hypothetical protein